MKELYYLQKGDKINIHEREYMVEGFIKLKQGAISWKEFHIKSNQGISRWLSVEINLDEVTVLLFETTLKFDLEKQITYNSDSYELLEEGAATIQYSENMNPLYRGIVIEYKEYIAVNEDTKFLIYEKTPFKIEYYFGQKVNLNDISIINKIIFDEKKLDKKSWSYWNSLPLDQKLTIRNKAYYISGIMKCKQNQYQWVEYKLAGTGASGLWFCVEPTSENSTELSLYKTIKKIKIYEETEGFTQDGVKYKLSETGKARVIDAQGNIDVSLGETFVFKEYISSYDGKKRISFENWEGNEEISQGEIIEENEVIVHIGQLKRVSINNLKVTKNYVLSTIAIIFIALIFTGFFEDKTPIATNLKSNALYTYVTSITANNASKAKADVYRSPYNTDKTCKEIIEMDPENIVSVSSSKDIERGEKLILTKTEYVSIYETKDSLTYVQVSEKINQDTYRSRNSHFFRRHYYYNTTGRTVIDPDINTTAYDRHIESARQASIRTRESLGGGTSYGK